MHGFCNVPSCHQTRRAFLRQSVTAAVASLLAARRLAGQTVPENANSGLAWGRLVTPSQYWTIHEDQDPVVAGFLRRAAQVNMDPVSRPVHADQLEELCSYPFLFTNNLTPLSGEADRANLAEYLRRGGFIYIDGCIEWRVTPSFPDFYRQHIAYFAQLIPGSDVRMLDENHPIFRSFLPVGEASTRTGRGHRGHWGPVAEALYGVYAGDRMISLLSLDHLMCGWPSDPERANNCVRQIANIYVYAMTR